MEDLLLWFDLRETRRRGQRCGGFRDLLIAQGLQSTDTQHPRPLGTCLFVCSSNHPLVFNHSFVFNLVVISCFPFKLFCHTG